MAEETEFIMDYTNKKSVTDINVTGKKVLVRCDFNVPMKDGVITDDKRITESLATITHLIKNGAKVILCSHLGRPKGEVNPKYSLAPVAVRLSELLEKEVKMSKDVIGEDSKAIASALNNGDVMLIENVRFYKEEEKNDPAYAKELAGLAEIFVNDAFGTSHRAHASTAGVADYLPSVCGFLIEKEIRIMGEALANPKRPFVVILGGAKVSDKIGVINNLIDKVDSLIIGGGMAYTFMKALGYKIGKSIVENDKLDLALELINKAAAKGVKLMLPVDNKVGDDFSNDCKSMVVESRFIPDEFEGMDIGPKTMEIFRNEILNAKTIIWNGPMGVFELDNFSNGTKAIATAVAESGAISIIGGGDSAAACEKLGFAEKMTHISTGGGASLEFLEGLELPGIACLDNK